MMGGSSSVPKPLGLLIAILCFDHKLFAIIEF